MTRRTILVATSNPGKRKEVRQMLAGLPLDVISLADLDPVPPAEESGETFSENAAIKALYYVERTGFWSLADDSGLEVDALGGQPGVRSARYAGVDARDADNNAKLIQELQHVPEKLRTARFRCAMALAVGTEIVATSIGAMEGIIVTTARGSNGFGYDPHFYIPELKCTSAELAPEKKNQISHRGKALASIRPAILRVAETS